MNVQYIGQLDCAERLNKPTQANESTLLETCFIQYAYMVDRSIDWRFVVFVRYFGIHKRVVTQTNIDFIQSISYYI